LCVTITLGELGIFSALIVTFLGVGKALAGPPLC
jgi:hypothetical protein